MTTTQPVPTLRRQDFALALAGPAVVGVALCLPWETHRLATVPLLLPLIFVGVMALLLPSLYIGLAFAGSTTSLRTLANTAVEALRDAGVALLGIAPALLFLGATSTSESFVRWLAIGAAAFLTVRAMCVRLSRRSELGVRLVILLAGFTVVALGIGGWLTVSLVILR